MLGIVYASIKTALKVDLYTWKNRHSEKLGDLTKVSKLEHSGSERNQISQILESELFWLYLVIC